MTSGQPPGPGQDAAPGRDTAGGLVPDAALTGLVVVNLVALGAALVLRMSLRDLMLVYWMQSVIIGLMNVIRILRLRDFSTEGLRQRGRQVPVTPGSKYGVAVFFCLHYGFFHFIYLFFLRTPGRGPEGDPVASYWLAGCALLFLVQHAFSLRQTLARDASGRPNLGKLMFLPYLRILPMHLTLIFGLGFLGGGSAALLLFGFLKTLADVGMHVVQQRIMK